jgi:hypothetical protein
LVVGLASPALAAEAKGKVKSVTADMKEFVVTDKDGKDWTFTLGDDAKIRLGDKELRLNELKVDDEVTFTYERKGDKMTATEIRCERK